jgi:hypothetical protein
MPLPRLPVPIPSIFYFLSSWPGHSSLPTHLYVFCCPESLYIDEHLCFSSFPAHSGWTRVLPQILSRARISFFHCISRPHLRVAVVSYHFLLAFIHTLSQSTCDAQLPSWECPAGYAGDLTNSQA